MTGFAQRTIWRFLRSKGIRLRDTFSGIIDEHLSAIVGGMISEN